MKKWLAGIGAVSGVVLVLVLAGPRPVVDTHIRHHTLPTDLEGYLRAEEASFDDLREGTNKTIIWADARHRRTPLSIIYLHGFSATRGEVWPLCDTLAARLGANLYYTRLTGHGRSSEAMGEATVDDWLDDAIEAFDIGHRLGEKVLIVGTSTGGTLATWLAAEVPEDEVAAVILISPNFGPADPKARMLTWPWGAILARMIVGPTYRWEPANEAQAHYWTTSYPSNALVTMMALVDRVNGLDLSTVHPPLLAVYGARDPVVSVAAIEEKIPLFGAVVTHQIRLEDTPPQASHVLAGAVLAPAMTLPLADSVMAFLKRIEKAGR